MITKQLIAPSRIQSPVSRPSFHFADRSGKAVNGITGPNYYSIQTRADGSVILREYESQQEFTEHRAHISFKLSQLHTSKVPGCYCQSCK